MEDRLLIKVDMTASKSLGSNEIFSIFQVLSDIGSFASNIVEWVDEQNNWKKHETDSFIDSIIKDIIDGKQDIKPSSLILINDVLEDRISFGMVRNESIYTLNFRFPKIYSKEKETDNLIYIIKSIINIASPISLSFCFEKISLKISDKHFLYQGRTPFSGNLVWLQYFGKEESYRQGGIEALESNPLLKTERIHDGLLIQVGESPYDAFTPEGEQLLIEATRSLPPVRDIS
jgi:hypothetical protein